MIEVEIRNFQSIDKLTFKIQGFTALVGKSNIGKSAIIRALKCALSGADGSSFIRHDEATCSRVLKKTQKCKCSAMVKMKFDDGRVLIWEKGDAVNQYQVIDRNGQHSVYDKIGQSPELPELLREEFSPVNIGKDKKHLQISDQFWPIFLLDVPGPTVADVLSDVAQLDDINQAMKLVSKDRKTASSTRKIRESDVRDLETGLDKYAGLEQVVSQVRLKQDGYAELLQKSEDLRQLEAFLTDFLTTGRIVKKLLGVSTVSVPPVEPLRLKARQYAKIAALHSELELKVQVLRGLQGVRNVVVPTAIPTQKAQLLERMGGWLARLQVLTRSVQVSKSLEGTCVPDVKGLKTKVLQVSRLKVWEVRSAALEHEVQVSDNISQLPVPEPRPLKATLARLHTASTLLHRMERLIQEISVAAHDLVTTNEEGALLQKEFDELGVCPTCSQRISSEHVICKA